MANKKDPRDHHLEDRNGKYYFRCDSHRFSLRTTNIKDARKQRDELLKQINIFGSLEKAEASKTPTFKDVAQEWLEAKQVSVRFSTYNRYKKTMCNDFAWLNKYKIDEITGRMIQKWVNRTVKEAEAETTHKNVGGYVQDKLRYLGNLFNYAYRNDLITINPVTKVEKPTSTPEEINPLDINQVHQFIETCRDCVKDYFIVAFFTGMRPEEQVGLKVKYVDFENNIIKVREVIDDNHRWGLPKTKAGIRDIPMFPMVRASVIKSIKGKGPEDRVFTNTQGNPHSRKNLHKNYWTETLVKMGIEHRKLYTTRHSFATNMIDAGEKLGTVAKWMGHANLKTLVKTYYRFLNEDKQDAGKAFMAAYNASKTDKQDTTDAAVLPIERKSHTEANRVAM
jgi:integrase